MSENFSRERREFVRIEYDSPLSFKVCKSETIKKILQGYISNISQSGILCSIREKVSENDILWLSFDRQALNICSELEKRALIYQNGVIGKVVRVEATGGGMYDLGIRFVTREEESSTHIYPPIKFGADVDYDDGQA